jgi:hypothetical protein
MRFDAGVSTLICGRGFVGEIATIDALDYLFPQNRTTFTQDNLYMVK